METQLRPGIYTSYTLMPAYRSGGGRTVGIVAKSAIRQEQVRRITSYTEARLWFGEPGEDNPMMGLLAAAFDAGAGALCAVSPMTEDTAGYEQAFEKLFAIPDLYLVTTDRDDPALAGWLAGRLAGLEGEGKERLAVLPAGAAAGAAALARSLNSRRVCLTCPVITGGDSAANLAPVLLAAQVSTTADLTDSLIGAALKPGYQVQEAFEEEQVAELLSGGICLYEQPGESGELIRGMTTCTLSPEGKADSTYRSLSVVLILDQVVPGVRELLKQKLKAARNDQASLGGIRSLIVCRLAELEEAGLLSSYQLPEVYLDGEDRTVCIVELSFTVRQGISQIYLNAQITV